MDTDKTKNGCRALAIASALLFAIGLASPQRSPKAPQILRGQVVVSGSLMPVPNTNIRMVGINSAATMPDGAFQLPVPPPLEPGSQVQLTVDGWEVVDPHQGMGGVMNLPNDFFRPLRVVVVHGVKGDLENPDVIQSLLEQFGHAPIYVRRPLTFERFLDSKAAAFRVTPREMEAGAKSWIKYAKDDNYNKGLLQFAIGDMAGAVRLLGPSVRTSDEARVAVALAQFNQGHYEQADQLWTDAMNRQAMDPIVMNNLGVTRFRRERPLEGEELFERALKVVERSDPMGMREVVRTNQAFLIRLQ
jgi:hypothetical protein